MEKEALPLGKALTGFMEGLAQNLTIVEPPPPPKEFDENDYNDAKRYYWKVLNHLAEKESGKKYIIDDQSREATAKSFYYITSQKEKCEELGLNLNKGLLFLGNPGSGKSILGRAMKYAGDYYHIRGMFMQFRHCECKLISLQYKEFGMKKVEYETKYTGPGTLPVYFEDIGKEDPVGNFEKPKELMVDILELRYNLWLKYGLKTLGDTNMDTEQITERFGMHIMGRIRQTMNMIVIGGKKEYIDRRKDL